MKLFIYIFCIIYIGLISEDIYIYLFDKYTYHVMGDINFFEPIPTTIIASIIGYFIEIIFRK
ncbi:hypothetical protein IO48_02680 [Gallibacterium anatis 4895]|uniref:Uncharacterized protein n=1 Tax=Gallibacterium anatis 4895 TaxID=1396510 RepID=A0A0A3A5W1_9PAST|nr:hypothetical protein IO48_02680 [Gallibacterium anatis 4895]